VVVRAIREARPAALRSRYAIRNGALTRAKAIFARANFSACFT